MPKKFVAILIASVGSLAILLLLFSGVWRYIVTSHVQQFNKTLPGATALAAQNILRAKASYHAAEYRAKRGYLEAQNRYELERIRLRTEMLVWYAKLKFYSVVGMIAIFSGVVIVLSCGYAGAKIRQASVCIARIGKYNKIPVHYQDLHDFYPIAVNLSVAEIEASVSTSHEKAYHISRQMLDDITNYTRRIAGKRGVFLSGSSRFHREDHTNTTANLTCSPPFAELLRTGLAAPNKPLVLGYNRQGEPQYCALKELKAMAVAGWQGSGKTLSMAYMVASSVFAYRVHAYVIDPHKHHPESLSSLIHPLEDTGCVNVVNPFDTPALIHELNNILDRRLNGQDSSTPGILLVIDELARLAKMECFDGLLAFLDRCTEETRKANITFIGSSHKWTARHFNGRADIRRCMNSGLIHKMKPSQAELLLEDTSHKHLVHQLRQPGEAILVTDYGTPTIVSMPLCTRKDVETVAEMVKSSEKEIFPSTPQFDIGLSNWSKKVAVNGAN